jgi:sugar/nucleoside kinase (ribokinase family)
MQGNNWAAIDEGILEKYIQTFSGKIVLGIDGFIDQVWQVVETRTTDNNYVLIDKMQKFGELIVNRKEGGMANELIKKRRSYGGFTANTGKALGNLELSTTLLGMYGKEGIDKIFDELSKKCTLISIGDPVISTILEFTDGKIMMPNLDDLLRFTWDDFVNALGADQLEKILLEADVLSLGYWSNMPAFDEFMNKLNENYFHTKCPKRLFFDFANIKKRSKEAIIDTFKVLERINNKIPVTLSLNEHEAVLLFSYYGKEFLERSLEDAQSTDSIRSIIGLDELIVHTPKYAVISSVSEGVGILEQDYCEAPVITTGAGDTFNGGYIASCLEQLNAVERLAIANAATRYYIGNGHTPSREELLSEIKRIKGALA